MKINRIKKVKVHKQYMALRKMVREYFRDGGTIELAEGLKEAVGWKG